jgi:ParB family chromosome partitioning protein
MSKQTGLGRGFESLIPQNFDNSLLLDESERIQKIKVADIQPNKEQPRQHFDEQAIAELAASIKQYGILQPLVVVALPGGKGYRIVAGERRWRAAQVAKLASVPAIVRGMKELEELEIALVENVQRVDLSPIEQAVSIERLHEQFSMQYLDIAKRLGKSSATISNTVRLLQLTEPARQALESQQITEGHARCILALNDQLGHQAELLKSIITQGWSVRQAERYVSGVKAGAKEVKEVKARVSTETPETKRLGKRLHTTVQVRRTAKGGKLEIGFQSDDELARIISLLDK